MVNGANVLDDYFGWILIANFHDWLLELNLRYSHHVDMNIIFIEIL
jgi:hypothetical protein